LHGQGLAVEADEEAAIDTLMHIDATARRHAPVGPARELEQPRAEAIDIVGADDALVATAQPGGQVKPMTFL
jgi:hypothetical protein